MIPPVAIHACTTISCSLGHTVSGEGSIVRFGLLCLSLSLLIISPNFHFLYTSLFLCASQEIHMYALTERCGFLATVFVGPLLFDTG